MSIKLCAATTAALDSCPRLRSELAVLCADRLPTEDGCAQRVLFSLATAANTAHAERVGLVRPIAKFQRPKVLNEIVTAVRGGESVAESVASVHTRLVDGTSIGARGIVGISPGASAGGGRKIVADLSDLF